MSTLHRRDIDSSDFLLLARFCRALKILTDKNGHLPWVLGTVEMWLPLWYSTGKSWKFSQYRLFEREAFGLPTAALRRVCRYLRVPEHELIYLLYRLSMLAVDPVQPRLQPCRYRMEFTGTPIDQESQVPSTLELGFILERRRAEGHFRTGNADLIESGR